MLGAILQSFQAAIPTRARLAMVQPASAIASTKETACLNHFPASGCRAWRAFYRGGYPNISRRKCCAHDGRSICCILP
jgi:hypothetical protein